MDIPTHYHSANPRPDLGEHNQHVENTGGHPIQAVFERAHSEVEQSQDNLIEIFNKLEPTENPVSKETYVELAQRILEIKRNSLVEGGNSLGLLQSCLNRSLTHLLESIPKPRTVVRDSDTCQMIEALIAEGAGPHLSKQEDFNKFRYRVSWAPLNMAAKIKFIETVSSGNNLTELYLLAMTYMENSQDEEKQKIVERSDRLFQNCGQLETDNLRCHAERDNVLNCLFSMTHQSRLSSGLKFLFYNKAFSNPRSHSKLYPLIFREATNPESDKSILNLILANGIRYPLVKAIENRPLDSDGGFTSDGMRRLVDAGAVDLAFISPKGNNLLHCVVRRGLQDLAIHLLDKGLDPNAQNANGETPRSLAKGNPKMEKFLQEIEFGAQVKG